MTEQELLAAGIRPVNSRQLYPANHQPGDAGLPMLIVENPLGRAVVALQGAHVMAFQPAGQDELLWVSPKTTLRGGVPIRGGIPLCLPWFGLGADGKTMHGFARTMEWTVTAAASLGNGATRLVLELAGDAATSALWPCAFFFRLEIEAGAALKMSIDVQNRGAGAAPLAFAFHTYFAVPDVAAARVAGLDGVTYIDKMDKLARKQQSGEVRIEAATDRVYLDVPPRQTIVAGARRVEIESGARCAVVWNAWNNDRNIPDLGEGNHAGYLCVERGDVADHAVTLPPGQNYRAWMSIAGA
ncbi:MAG: D-hexose-6-phosphate mutarotase [Candidatus Accumulibacter sp.]|jgi:D-hexose-6-phosphate mutarotase|nr:D-hexose-6-phosphate mutarotase [Accumulibacter sp.]